MKISIVTISYNNIEDLQKTCNSIDEQSIAPYEHIIIDGSTVNDISNWLNSIAKKPYRTFYCEKDNGIADAFNKGINKSSGEIIQLLNAGDSFFDNNALSIVQNKLNKNNKINWLHGKYEYFRGSHWVIIGKKYNKNLLYRGMRSICHQTMFVKKEVYDEFGLYDQKLKIGMDYDFICRISNISAEFINDPLIKMKPDGISNTNYLESLKEMSSIYKKHNGFSILHHLWKIRLILLYYLMNTKFGKFLFKLKYKIKLSIIV
jgi:glycosyltransferase involved in cell wall biosynthesis